MIAIAKVFTTGNSQAIRLPKAFRVNVQEMWIARNDLTGEITLKPKPQPNALEAFFSELQAQPCSAEFLQPRDDKAHSNPLQDWMI